MKEQQKDRTEKTVFNLLAEKLGLEPSDISHEDNLVDDLGMNASDLTDLAEMLSDKGFETSDIDFTQIESVRDLLEALDLQD